MDKPIPKIVTSREFLLQVKAKYKLPTTYALAKKMDMPPRTIGRYLNQDVIKQASVMVRISDLLEVDLSYVIYNLMAEDAARDGENDVAQSFFDTAQQYAPIGLAVSACFCLFFLPFGLPL